MSQKQITLVSSMMAAFVAAASSAHAIPWGFGTDAGSNSAFVWSEGEWTGANAGAFGSPTVTTAGFFFVNEFGDMDFRVEPGESIHDITRVEVVMDTATEFITVRESGTWAGNPDDFNVTAYFSVFRNLPAHIPPGSTGAIDLPPLDFVDEGGGQGTWSTEHTLRVGDDTPMGNTDQPWVDFKVTLSNFLQINGGVPDGSSIEKTGVEIIIPEPSTLFLLATICPLMLRRNGRGII